MSPWFVYVLYTAVETLNRFLEVSAVFSRFFLGSFEKKAYVICWVFYPIFVGCFITWAQLRQWRSPFPSSVLKFFKWFSHWKMSLLGCCWLFTQGRRLIRVQLLLSVHSYHINPLRIFLHRWHSLYVVDSIAKYALESTQGFPLPEISCT